MKRKLLIALAIVTALVLAGAGTALWLTRGLADTVDTFFADVREGRMEPAMDLLSQGFRSETGRADLERFLDQQDMREVIDAEWNRRRIENQQGLLEGTLVTRSGVRIPVRIGLIREADGWRIHRIERPAAGIASGSAPTPPDTATALALATATIRDFFHGLSAGSMRAFHQNASSLLKAQFEVEDLDAAYRAFLDLDLDGDALARVRPVIEGVPKVDADGVPHI